MEKRWAIGGKSLSFYCQTIYHNSDLRWYKRTAGIDRELDPSLITTSNREENGISYLIKTVNLKSVTQKDSGTYVCKIFRSFPADIILATLVDAIVRGESVNFNPKPSVVRSYSRPNSGQGTFFAPLQNCSALRLPQVTGCKFLRILVQ